MLINTLVRTAVLLMAAGVLAVAQTPGRREISAVYPHLAMFNAGNECGTGAVVPWADRLWVLTYAPHQPHGSDDKLYEIDAALNQVVRPESVGGTPANRMIHRESGQLFIGPYAIDRAGAVRQLFEDANAAQRRKAAPDISGPLLPGHHGKGLHSGQGRLVYSNNGEYGGEAMPPDAPSGCLAEWDGHS
jgi:hypothetical protein